MTPSSAMQVCVILKTDRRAEREPEKKNKIIPKRSLIKSIALADVLLGSRNDPCPIRVPQTISTELERSKESLFEKNSDQMHEKCKET